MIDRSRLDCEPRFAARFNRTLDRMWWSLPLSCVAAAVLGVVLESCRRADLGPRCDMPTNDPNAPSSTANPETRRDDKLPVDAPNPANTPQRKPEDLDRDLTIRKGPATQEAERPRSKP